MIIAVDKKLKAVKAQLIKMGYDVVEPLENVMADVYIYSVTNGGFNNSVKATNDGCLVINADENSMDDIVYALSNRVYTPLF